MDLARAAQLPGCQSALLSPGCLLSAPATRFAASGRSCPENDSVECFAEPCAVSSCPAFPGARCLASYCETGTYEGKPVGPCEAVYVNLDGSRVDCKAPVIRYVRARGTPGDPQ